MVDKVKKTKSLDSVRKKSFYLLPNVFTTGALFAGFYSIVQAMNGHYDHAAIAIFVALIMDGLDGRIARLTQTQSAFGGEYDSLSDMVSFGVAPALVMYVWALQPLGRLGWVAAFIYCACAAIRLARFNVKLDIDNKKYFFGLPSPAAATATDRRWTSTSRTPSTRAVVVAAKDSANAMLGWHGGERRLSQLSGSNEGKSF